MRGRERIRENDGGMETVCHGPNSYSECRAEGPSIDHDPRMQTIQEVILHVCENLSLII